MRFGWTFAALAFVAVIWSCDSGSDGGKKCTDHTDCDQGTVCVGGSCAEVECTKHSECPSEFCAPAGVVAGKADKQFCSPLECTTAAECIALGLGDTCNQYKQCVGGTPEPDAQPQDGIDDDATIPPDVVTPGEQITSCIACKTDAECALGSCHPLEAGTYCFEDCTTNDDCPTGWLCFSLTANGKQCVPMKMGCGANCLITPCGNGQVCNQDTGECQAAKTECGGCQQDWECPTGYRCNQMGKYCAPECGAADLCPANSTCQEVNNIKVKVCVSGCAPCCYGDACQCGEPCPLDKPYRNSNDECVECLNDTHCTNGTCSSLGVCQGTNTCPPEKPKLDNGVCVECTIDADCAPKGAGFTCKNKKCSDGNEPPECSYCVDPYPACVQINEIWSCVGCKTDGDCPVGWVCDASLFACSDPTLPPDDGEHTPCNQCSSDAECTSSKGLTLKCDTAYKCCYDPAGGACDKVEVNCEGGLPCKSLLDLLGGGMGGGLPGMPMPTDGMGGSCGCTNPTSDLMALLPCLMGGCPDSEGCAAGSICVDPNAVMGMLGGGGTPSTSTTGMCFNLSDLLGGLF